MRTLSDWIDNYLLYTDNTEASRDFRQWTAISIMAACLRRKCYLPWGKFNVYPNMYIVLVGPSGCRKGTAMGPGAGMLSEIGVKMTAEAITREALIRELSKSSDTIMSDSGVQLHSSLTIYSQELAVFLGYNNMQLMADLCNWFDCPERWVYRTKNQGEDDIMGVWVNLIGATTPELLQSTLPRDAIGGGLTSRMIMVYAPKKGKTVVAPFETKAEKQLRQQLVDDLEKVNMMVGEFKITEEFVEEWARWYPAQDHNGINDFRLSGYNERRPTHALKLAMIMSTSRSSDMRITVADFRKGTEAMAAVEKNMLHAYTGVGRNKNADIINRVLSMLAVRGRLSMAEVSSMFYFDADRNELNIVAQSLKDMGCADIEYPPGDDTVLIYKKEIGQ